MKSLKSIIRVIKQLRITETRTITDFLSNRCVELEHSSEHDLNRLLIKEFASRTPTVIFHHLDDEESLFDMGEHPSALICVGNGDREGMHELGKTRQLIALSHHIKVDFCGALEVIGKAAIAQAVMNEQAEGQNVCGSCSKQADNARAWKCQTYAEIFTEHFPKFRRIIELYAGKPWSEEYRAMFMYHAILDEYDKIYGESMNAHLSQARLEQVRGAVMGVLYTFDELRKLYSEADDEPPHPEATSKPQAQSPTDNPKKKAYDIQ